jgi:hypothetical protein
MNRSRTIVIQVNKTTNYHVGLMRLFGLIVGLALLGVVIAGRLRLMDERSRGDWYR